MGAIIALAHDAIITLGLYSLFNIPFDVSVIAAILTLLGYSLNDTIVVYDRIRENLKRSRKNTMEKTINDSINQVLGLSLIHISEPTRPLYISYAVFCLKKKKT
eukprot:TRINITY_DN34963_c0_g1_i1.p1 TRINITY_DN34963_c0_g1~~TRINITY_DN34963_c0_g1_i1.p1  ORF type:complete len:104 (-),score=15.87 TRINITY_DN34963_c0_g1_i1:54-365(-)